MWRGPKISSISSHVVGKLSSSISSLQHLIRELHLHYSTTATPSSTHFMVDYLVNSLGFSTDEASSAARKVSHLKSAEKPDLILYNFKQSGLSKTQIKSIILTSPEILRENVKTLVSKLRLLQEIGVSGRGLERLLKPSRSCSYNRLHSNIHYLRELLGSDEKVAKVVTKAWWIANSDFQMKVSLAFSVLKKHGLSDDRILRLLVTNPVLLLQNPEWIEEKIQRVESELGISSDSPTFVDGILILGQFKKSSLERKFGIFRSFGWSDSDILMMTKVQPYCLKRSEATIRKYLDFFMNKLGYTSEYLASHSRLLLYSLEKRVLPRNQVLEILKRKKLLKKEVSLCSLLACPEDNFVKKYVLPYNDHLPDLYHH